MELVGIYQKNMSCQLIKGNLTLLKPTCFIMNIIIWYILETWLKDSADSNELIASGYLEPRDNNEHQGLFLSQLTWLMHQLSTGRI